MTEFGVSVKLRLSAVEPQSRCLIWQYISGASDLAINHLRQPLLITASLSEMPAVSFQAILDKGLVDYHKQIGIELDKHPFAEELRGSDSPDDVLKLLENKANAFKVFRDGNRKLINWLNPVVQAIHMLSGVLGEAVSFN